LRSFRVALGLATATALVLVPAGSAHASYWYTTANWHMDETAGAPYMTDSSGYANHGRVYNVVTGTTGYSRYGYYFQPNSVAAVASSTTLNPGSRDITITENVLTTARVRDWNVTQKGFSTTPGGQYKIEIRPRNGGGVVACAFRGSLRHAVIVAGPNVADGRWHHIVCAKYASSIALKVDDGPVYRQYVTVGTISNTEGLTIGGKAPGDDQYIGRVDEVTVQILV